MNYSILILDNYPINLISDISMSIVIIVNLMPI